MYYEVYIDSLFFTNLCLNLLLLSLLRKIQKCTATHLRILSGAAFGAFCECILVVMVPCPIWIKMVLAYGLVSVIMVKIGLRITELNQLLRSTVLLFIMAFTFYGAMDFLLNQMQLIKGHRIKVMELLSMAYAAYWFLKWFLIKISDKRSRERYRVHIISSGKEMNIMALLDTGNGLQDPISGQPVSIIEEEAMQCLKPYEEQPGYRIIPFHSIGKANGVLPGFRVERMTICGKLEAVTCESVIVGVYEGKISSDNQYQMILHPKLLEN